MLTCFHWGTRLTFISTASCCVVVEEGEWLRFTSSSFKLNFAFRRVNAYSDLLLDWKNHEIHLLQIVVRDKKVYLILSHQRLSQNRRLTINAHIRPGQEIHRAKAQAVHENLQRLRRTKR
jgi:hypothetical protein